MPLIDFYKDTRNKFPQFVQGADNEHIKYWGEVNSEYAYSWFESLAKALNIEMAKMTEQEEIEKLYIHMEYWYKTADEEIKDCIDVSFVENLFWELPTNKIEAYWNILPQIFKELYVNFHQRKPL